jgi:hypothetical protein
LFLPRQARDKHRENSEEGGPFSQVTLDFIGLQNEGEITGGPANFSTALRASLDAAGFSSTLIDCCDAHDWKDLEPLFENHSSAFFQVRKNASFCAI